MHIHIFCDSFYEFGYILNAHLHTVGTQELSIYLSFCLSIYLSAYLSIYLSISLPTYRPILSICLSIYFSTYLCILNFDRKRPRLPEGAEGARGLVLWRTVGVEGSRSVSAVNTRAKSRFTCLEAGSGRFAGAVVSSMGVLLMRKFP